MNKWFAPRDEANGKYVRTFLIGARAANRKMDSWFDGLIDEVMVLDRPLSAEDVTNLYCGLRPEGCLE